MSVAALRIILRQVIKAQFRQRSTSLPKLLSHRFINLKILTPPTTRDQVRFSMLQLFVFSELRQILLPLLLMYWRLGSNLTLWCSGVFALSKNQVLSCVLPRNFD